MPKYKVVVRESYDSEDDYVCFSSGERTLLVEAMSEEGAKQGALYLMEQRMSNSYWFCSGIISVTLVEDQ